MKFVRGLALTAGLAAALIGGSARAQENLIVATLSQEEASLPQKFYIPWAQAVEKASQGTLKLDIRNGYAIANLNNSLDRLNDDVVQITMVVHSQTAAQFPLIQVSSLPFLSQKAEDGGIALWRLYKAGLLDSEMKDYVPFVFNTFGYNSIHLVKAPRNLDDLQSLRIVTTSRLLSDMMKLLGAAPSSASPMDAYPALQRSAYDGVLTAWPSMTTFHLLDVTSYHVDVALGATPYMIAMTRKRYEALPALARKALDENSGEHWIHILASQGVDDEVDRAHAVALSKGQTVVNLSPQQLAGWESKTKPVVDEAVAALAARPGGKEVLAKYPALLADVQAGR